MGGKKGGESESGNRPLQTPTAGEAPATANVSSSHLKLDEVPVSGRVSPMKGGLTPTSGRPQSTTTVDTEKTKEIMTKVDAATKTMEQNIQAATQRGESLNELQDKTRKHYKSNL